MSNNWSISRKYPFILSVAGLCIIAVTMISVNITLTNGMTTLKKDLSESERDINNERNELVSDKIAKFLDLNLFVHLHQRELPEINKFIKLLKLEMPVVSVRIADAGGKVLTDGTKENSAYGERLDTSRLKSSPLYFTKTENGSKLLFPIQMRHALAGYGEVVFSGELLPAVSRQREKLLDNVLTKFENTLANTGLILTLTVIAATVLLSIGLTRKVSVPLLTITDAAKRIAGGDLSAIVPIQSKDEIGALAEHFNAMVEKLNSANFELSDYTRNLELLIALRTEKLNAALETLKAEIAERRQAEEQLQQYRIGLEEIVNDRTRRLQETIGILNDEISGRIKVEKELAEKVLDVEMSRKTLLDIMEDMKYTEGMLRDSGTRYRSLYQEFQALLDATSDIMLLLSPDLKITWANKAAERISGKTADELVGHYCYEGWRNRSSQCEDCYAQRSLDSATVADSRITAPDGSIVDVRAFPLIADDGGAIKNVLIVGRDMTEKIRLEETARRTYHLAQLGGLSAGMAHEINNPNNFILSNAQLLQDVWYDAAKILHKHYEENGDFIMGGLPFSEMNINVSRMIARITEGSKRISNIVDSLKGYASPKEGAPYKEIDINRTINYSLLIIGHQVKKFTDNFTVDLSEDLPPVLGHSHALEELIINIVMNALQALPDRSGQVRIFTRHDDGNGQVIIGVRDEGVGMSGETLNRVFDPFFTTKHDNGGIGLGLSISCSIIKDHNGSLEFESEPGKGTTAIVKLPCAAYLTDNGRSI